MLISVKSADFGTQLKTKNDKMDEKKSKKPRVVKMKPTPAAPREMKAQVIPRNGHTLFEVDKEAMTIKPCDYKMVKKMVEVIPAMAKILKTNFTLEFVEKEVKEVIIRPNCLYISALNPKNVMKILERNFGFKPAEPLTKKNHGISRIDKS